MIIGKLVQQSNNLLYIKSSDANQYSENLELSIEFSDTLLNGYTLLFIYCNDRHLLDTHALQYDTKTKTLTLPLGFFSKDGNSFIGLRAIKGTEVISTNAERIYIGKSLNPNVTNLPKDPATEVIVNQLIQQFFDNEYKVAMDEMTKLTKKAVDDSNKIISEVNRRLANDEFRGEIGPQGMQGEQGTQGAQGISGVVAQSSGTFALEMDSASGNLYCLCPDATNQPKFDYTAGGDVFLILEETV